RVMTAKTSQMSPEDHGAEPVAAQRGTARLAGGPGETQWSPMATKLGRSSPNVRRTSARNSSASRSASDGRSPYACQNRQSVQMESSSMTRIATPSCYSGWGSGSMDAPHPNANGGPPRHRDGPPFTWHGL